MYGYLRYILPLPRIVPLHKIQLHNLCAENTFFLLLLNFNDSPQKLNGLFKVVYL